MNFRDALRRTMVGLLHTLFALFLLSSSIAVAQTNPFQNGWSIDTSQSLLEFESLKNETISETSSFAEVYGIVSESGQARLTVALDSVDTKVDLRNVRMRFLFFETFNFPTALIAVDLTPDVVSGLTLQNPLNLRLPLNVELRGITQTYLSDLRVSMISPTSVQIETISPISISIADFELIGGLGKLEDAANVRIRPSTNITAKFVFNRNGSDNATTQVAETQSDTEETPRNAALEPAGDFSREACIGRFEILSRTGNIYFQSGSSTLSDTSTPLLEEVYDIVSRCPNLSVVIAGHTDSTGPEAANQRLSEARAQSVLRYLRNKGDIGERVRAVGYGETRPIATNNTVAGRQSNRRIEFAEAS